MPGGVGFLYEPPVFIPCSHDIWNLWMQFLKKPWVQNLWPPQIRWLEAIT